jgi:hypothetical protein
MNEIRAAIEALDSDGLASLSCRSLVETRDWPAESLEALLGVADVFERLHRAGRRTLLAPGELAYALFFDNSTRTKSAWAGAAARLGMHPVIVDGSSTQVSHGETAEETGAMRAGRPPRPRHRRGQPLHPVHAARRGAVADRRGRPSGVPDGQPPV